MCMYFLLQTGNTYTSNADDELTRTSTIGKVVFAAGGALTWGSQLKDYSCDVQHAQQISTDSQSTLSSWTVRVQRTARNPVYHQRSKHIEIMYHRIREHVNSEREHRTARLIHTKTANQSADKVLIGPDCLRLVV